MLGNRHLWHTAINGGHNPLATRIARSKSGSCRCLAVLFLYSCTFLNDCGIVTQVAPSFLNRNRTSPRHRLDVIVRRNPHPINSLAILSMAQR